jgi:hypothetical protein
MAYVKVLKGKLGYLCTSVIVFNISQILKMRTTAAGFLASVIERGMIFTVDIRRNDESCLVYSFRISKASNFERGKSVLKSVLSERVERVACTEHL